ncbi:hypothetical protein AVEN_13743-1 [Araneus ventricosus]|uniref:Uncharacterized protein n=1 Tax=Araneus ventricosus TaxID=182803 RepID=A0A4Y2LID4_ARAVE|nr:hypothetical protein AVEN_13743-1 [Araneus ventricosus]
MFPLRPVEGLAPSWCKSTDKACHINRHTHKNRDPKNINDQTPLSENDRHVLGPGLAFAAARGFLESQHGSGGPDLPTASLPKDVAIRVGQICPGRLGHSPRPAGVSVIRVTADNGSHVGFSESCLYLEQRNVILEASDMKKNKRENARFHESLGLLKEKIKS